MDFFYTEGCVHILMIIFFFFLFIFLLIFCMYTLLKKAVLRHYLAVLPLLASLDNCYLWLNEISILAFTLFSISSL